MNKDVSDKPRHLGIFSKPDPKKCEKCRTRKPQKEHVCPFDNEDGIVCNCCVRCEGICVSDQLDLMSVSGSHKKK